MRAQQLIAQGREGEREVAVFGGGCVSSELLIKLISFKKQLNKADSKINWKTRAALPGAPGCVQLLPGAARVCQSSAGAVWEPLGRVQCPALSGAPLCNRDGIMLLSMYDWVCQS